MAFILAVDFDGTLFSGSYPEQGEPKHDIINKLTYSPRINSGDSRI